MTNDLYNLKDKSDTELHQWIAEHEPGSDRHVEAIQELMRRNEAPVRKREWIAIGIAIAAITVAIIAAVITYQ